MGESNAVVNINFLRVDCISSIAAYLKSNAADVYHRGGMCYVLGYINVLVTILNEEEEIRHNAVCFNIKFKFQSLSCLLIYNVLVILLIRIEEFIGRIIETCF